jgi:hypothetical protein
MTSNRLTHHALMRMAQRGLKGEDMDLIMWMGTEVEGGYLVRDKDFEAFRQDVMAWVKQLLDRARRLVGMRSVAEGALIVTAYRAGPAKGRWLLRHVEQRAMGGANLREARRKQRRERNRGGWNADIQASLL